MHIQPYSVSELKFAYTYRVYFRWQTYRRIPTPKLEGLTAESIQQLVDRFGLHVLEASSSATEVLCLVSLKPPETVAAAISKIKGQLSKWLRESSGQAVRRVFSRGYFAATTGKSTPEAVEKYLETQGNHHGYDDRWAKPPVWVESFAVVVDDEEEERLRAAHSHTMLRLHCVLSSWRRLGVFDPSMAVRVTAAWRALAPAELRPVQSLVRGGSCATGATNPPGRLARGVGLSINECRAIGVDGRSRSPGQAERFAAPLAAVGLYRKLR